MSALALSGTGSIASSSDVVVNGTLDISATTSGASITTLLGTGAGKVALGAQTLKLTNASGTFSGVISGTGGFTLAGGGTLILDGVNTYTGTATISGGTLEVGDASTPTASIASDVDVESSGTLRGHGTVNGDVTNDGIVYPGGSIGTLAVSGNYTQNSDGTLQIDVTPTKADELVVVGTTSLAGTLNLIYAPGTYTATTYTLVSAKALTGSFATVNDAGSVPMVLDPLALVRECTLSNHLYKV